MSENSVSQLSTIAIVHACTIAILHACIIAIIHACTIAIIHACIVSCTAYVPFWGAKPPRKQRLWGAPGPQLSENSVSQLSTIAIVHACTITLLHACIRVCAGLWTILRLLASWAGYFNGIKIYSKYVCDRTVSLFQGHTCF